MELSVPNLPLCPPYAKLTNKHEQDEDQNQYSKCKDGDGNGTDE